MTQALHPVLSVRLFTDEKCFGPGIAQLLTSIDAERSLRKAAAAMGMAYSKAWTILRRSEKALGYPLVRAEAGGTGGGGTELTEAARAILARYGEYCQRVNAFAAETFSQMFD